MKAMQEIEAAIFRLSLQQQSVIAAQERQERVLCVSGALPLGADVDARQLCSAIDTVNSRHEILRTLYQCGLGQRPAGQQPGEQLRYVLVDARDGQEDQAHAERAARADIDLDAGPVLSCRLIRTVDEDRLVFALPRLAADRQAAEQFCEEIRAEYSHAAAGQGLDLQYVDYAEWQHGLLHGELPAAAEQFWRAAQAVPADVRIRWEQRASDASWRTRHVELGSDELEHSIARLVRDCALERQDVALTLWTAFLAEIEERSQLVVGITCDTRGEAIAGVLGPFTVRLPVVMHVDRSVSVRKALRTLSLRIEESRSWAQYCKGSGPCSFAFDDACAGATAAILHVDEPCDFKLKLRCNSDNLSLVCPEALLSANALSLRAAQFKAFIINAARDIDQPLANIDLRGEAERRRVLDELTPKTRSLAGPCVHRVIEARAANSGEATALVFGAQVWTYQQLNGRANQLARQLREWQVGPESLVAVCAERSADLVVALLAILKCGGAYLPIDPGYPPERIAYMLDDAKPRVVLTQERLLRLLPSVDSRVWCLDRDASDIDDQSHDDLPGFVHPRSLAYCIYTSGSTGRPKACQIEHASLTYYLRWADAYYFGADGQGGSFGLYSSLSFDLTVTSLFLPLMRGQCLHVFAEDEPVDTVLTRSFAPSSSLDAIKLTPSHISLLRVLQLPPSEISLAIVGGEALLPEQVSLLHGLNPRMRVYNEYGPTEATVGCVVQLIERNEQDVAIGRPIEGCRVYVLDGQGELAPLGMTGELHIAGTNLARGYRGRPALTAERFVPDAHSDVPGARMYRTGDLVRYRADGVLEYVGRADHQVKVRGHRIELGEIEARLVQLAEVQDAAVVVRESDSGERRLVAYVVTERSVVTDVEAQAAMKERLREALSKQLPEYMAPAQYVFLRQLPLNANGKIDRKALPAPEVGEQSKAVAPRNATEAQLAAIWTQVLKPERLSVHDNFFELGGDSIVAIQVVSKARDAGLGFTPKELFQHPTIAELARVARTAAVTTTSDEVASGDVPLTPIQHWFFQLPLSHRDHWNQSVLLELTRPLDGELLEKALQRLVEQHDALRLRFSQRADGSWRQWYADDWRIALSSTVALENAADVEAHADQVQQRLNLSQGPVLRALQMALPNGGARLLLVIHHLVVDGVSWRILLDDLKNIYQALQTGAQLCLPARSATFQVWSRALQDYADSEQVREQLPYWRQVIANGAPKSAHAGQRGTAQSCSVELDETCTRRLLTQAHLAYRTQINDLLLTALARVLSRWSGQHSVLVELEGHGREELFEHVDVTRTVGWFTTQYPVLLSSGTGDLGQAVRSVKQQLREVPHNGLGYGVLRFLRGEQELRYPNGAIQARFNHLGQFDNSFDASGDWRPAKESMGRGKAEAGEDDAAFEWTTMVYDNRLRIRCAGTEAVGTAQLEQLLEHYVRELRELVDHCLEETSGSLSPADVPLADVTQEQLDRLPVAARQVEDIYALSPMQQGLLLHTLLNLGSGMYLMQDVFHTDRALDVEAVRRAWDSVVARHAILRTSFMWQESAAPIQVVHRTVPTAVQFLDWSGMQRAAAEARLQQVLREELATGFDVAHPCLSRLRLVRIDSSQYLLAHSFHHLLMDAWCRSLLFEDFLACYTAELSHTSPSRPEPRRYRDFIEWLGRQDKEAARSFWRDELAGFTAVTPVPLASNSAGKSRSTVTDLMERLTISETQALNQFAQDHRLTVNTVVQGAWALVLALHADQQEVLFGVTVAGRPTELAGIEATLGLFINSLPLRVQLPPPSQDVSVSSWLQSLLAKNVFMRQHEHLPLVEIQSLSALAPGTPLFQTLFVFENAPFAESVAEQANALGMHGLSGRTHTNYPLTVVAASGERFLLELSCDLRYFDIEVAERLLRQLRHVLLALLQHPHASMRDLNWLGDAELSRVTELEAVTGAAYSLQSSFIERFEAQVRERGMALAARCESEQISYLQLNTRANRIANALIARGVQRDDLVVIYAPRTLDMLSMLLGTFKSGAGYLALEPGYPAQRFQHVLRLARPKVVLGVERHEQFLAAQLSELPAEGRPTLLMIDSEEIREAAERDPRIYASQRQLAYMIYTSGSTGVPKGVMVEHAGMLNNQLSKVENLMLGGNDVIAQTASCSFDISVWQWLTALLCGARVEVIPDAMAHDPLQLLRAVRDRGVTVLESVPSLIQAMLLEEHVELPALRYLIATGEALPAAIARRWLERYPEVPLLNAYGPAECSDDVSMHQQATLPDIAATNVSIGRATPNNRLHILGRDLQRLPAGAIGEICVAGVGVGRGYLRDAARTAALFVADPCGGQGERLYRTGDLGRYRADGSLEYLGRCDQQVKILGHRIEPGEIEARLADHPDVAAAAVTVSQPSGKSSQLVAYVVPVHGGVGNGELRDRLRVQLLETLPKYMVPARFVWLAALPLNANGKIDRHALAAYSDVDNEPVVLPQTPLEMQLAAIWQEVLRVERVGLHDDFFELGGHSLLATQVVARIRQRLGIELPLPRLFEATTIAALARVLEQCSAATGHNQEVATMSSLLEALEAQ